MTHTCVSKVTINGSDNGLSPGWRQVIVWTNAGMLLIGLQVNIAVKYLSKLIYFHSRKCISKCRLINRVSASMYVETKASCVTSVITFGVSVHIFNKIAANFLTTIPNAFSWMKVYKFQLRFHWSLFLRVKLTISQHWFSNIVALSAMSHYLNQWWE